MNRYNKQILDEKVLVIDETGNNLGSLNTYNAVELAQSKGLDLVEVGPGVCKIQDYQKYLYQQKKANKSKPSPALKEFQFGINIADHDLETKIKHIDELLVKKHPIRLVVRLYGRENAHPDKGFDLLGRILQLLPSTASSGSPKQEGNQIIITIRSTLK